MTIRELVAALQREIDAGRGDVEVQTEGCDCYGDVASLRFVGDAAVEMTMTDKAVYRDATPYVLLERGDASR